jgi:hypothetical protein
MLGEIDAGCGGCSGCGGCGAVRVRRVRRVGAAGATGAAGAAAVAGLQEPPSRTAIWKTLGAVEMGVAVERAGQGAVIRQDNIRLLGVTTLDTTRDATQFRNAWAPHTHPDTKARCTGDGETPL